MEIKLRVKQNKYKLLTCIVILYLHLLNYSKLVYSKNLLFYCGKNRYDAYNSLVIYKYF